MKDDEARRARLQDAAFVVACVLVFAAMVANVQLGASRTLWQALMHAG